MEALHEVAHRLDRQEALDRRLEMRRACTCDVLDRRDLGDVIATAVLGQLDAPLLEHLARVIWRIGIWHLVANKAQRTVHHVERQRIGVERVDLDGAIGQGLLEHTANLASVPARHRIFAPRDLAAFQCGLRLGAGLDDARQHLPVLILARIDRAFCLLDRAHRVACLARRIDSRLFFRRRRHHVGLKQDALGRPMCAPRRHFVAALVFPMCAGPSVPADIANVQKRGAEVMQQPGAVAGVVLRLLRARNQHLARDLLLILGPFIFGGIELIRIALPLIGGTPLRGVRGVVDDPRQGIMEGGFFTLNPPADQFMRCKFFELRGVRGMSRPSFIVQLGVFNSVIPAGDGALVLTDGHFSLRVRVILVRCDQETARLNCLSDQGSPASFASRFRGVRIIPTWPNSPFGSMSEQKEELLECALILLMYSLTLNQRVPGSSPGAPTI
ncbi:hypothetical protein G6321_00001130 (plasmid) [Bradyrhizobium barranii subsp. barranii]|uniref:Uncharacterized protein n=1 Tax=Bradyrhizobium barranii subsp. barranii TaxID=2823807 RepID=A0A9X9YFT8_9BRAD|nr:hypothetical protein [Bradyrhizobium barranii]UGX89793.1 hypothetical protein G6321_00001130 [Bradyrhizobium barranii subsp. barranii]